MSEPTAVVAVQGLLAGGLYAVSGHRGRERFAWNPEVNCFLESVQARWVSLHAGTLAVEDSMSDWDRFRAWSDLGFFTPGGTPRSLDELFQRAASDLDKFREQMERNLWDLADGHAFLSRQECFRSHSGEHTNEGCRVPVLLVYPEGPVSEVVWLSRLMLEVGDVGVEDFPGDLPGGAGVKAVSWSQYVWRQY